LTLKPAVALSHTPFKEHSLYAESGCKDTLTFLSKPNKNLIIFIPVFKSINAITQSPFLLSTNIRLALKAAAKIH